MELASPHLSSIQNFKVSPSAVGENYGAVKRVKQVGNLNEEPQTRKVNGKQHQSTVRNKLVSYKHNHKNNLLNICCHFHLTCKIRHRIFVQQVGVMYSEYRVNRPSKHRGYCLNMEHTEMCRNMNGSSVFAPLHCTDFYFPSAGFLSSEPAT